MANFKTFFLLVLFLAAILFHCAADAADQKSNTEKKQDEELTKQLYDQYLAYLKPFPQPKWEEIKSVSLPDVPPKAFAQTLTFIDGTGDYIVVTRPRIACEVYDVRDGKPIATIPSDKKFVPMSAKISPNGEFLFIELIDRTMAIWNIKEKKAIKSYANKTSIMIPDYCFTTQGDKAISLDMTGLMHINTLVEGENEVTIRRNKNLPKSLGPNRVAISPDGRTLIASNTVDYHIECIQLDPGLNMEKNVSIQRETPVHSTPHSVFCTNRDYFYVRGNGVLCSRSIDWENKRDFVFTIDQIPFNGDSAKTVLSPDSKTAAFYESGGILFFSIENPTQSCLIGMPERPARQSVHLMPDMRHLVIFKDNNHFTIWKMADTDCLDRISRPPVMLELIKAKKFDLIDRVFRELDMSEEIQKYGIVASLTGRYLDHFTTLLDRATEYDKQREAYKNFVNWANSSKDNTIARILLAQKNLRKADRLMVSKDEEESESIDKPEENKEAAIGLVNEAEQMLQPLLDRPHIPAEALRTWMGVNRLSPSVEENADQITNRILAHHPLNSEIFGYVTRNMLRSSKRRAEQYTAQIMGQVEEKFADALYATMMMEVPYRYHPLSRNSFSEEREPLDQGNFAMDFDQMFKGADQLIEIFPDSPAGATLGLRVSLYKRDAAAAKKYLQILDEKHFGIIERKFMNFYELSMIRHALNTDENRKK